MRTVERLLEVAKRVIDARHHAHLTPGSLLFDEKLLDSFDIVRLVAEIESEFSITIQTDDLVYQNFNSIQDISALVDRSLSAAR
jgi:D-alanine--poly(phosphoribitol) ligase subunit 2